ncbi:hypothetical protein NDK43_29355 [Neobacillus pocheonensis]|uniref:Uncharacterized protein n=1 Tax=Neobacillus pocheonensis TaxID=363869 RepID=A0ABT0WH63_9BACI|nr:hypothetical protein [Neobacillus pocheonensis]
MNLNRGLFGQSKAKKAKVSLKVMIKSTNLRYVIGQESVDLKKLFRLSYPVIDNKGILRSIHTTMANGVAGLPRLVCKS